MGQVTDIKAGNRGCQFNDRFYFESVGVSSNIGAQGHATYDGSSGLYSNEFILIQVSSETSSSAQLYLQLYPPAEGTMEGIQYRSQSITYGNKNTIYQNQIDQYGDLYSWADTTTDGGYNNSQIYTTSKGFCFVEGSLYFGNNTITETADGHSEILGYIDKNNCVDGIHPILYDDATDCNTTYSLNSTECKDILACPGGLCLPYSEQYETSSCAFPSFEVIDPNPSAIRKIEVSETITIGTDDCPIGEDFAEDPNVSNKNCTTINTTNKRANLSGEIDIFNKNKQITNIKLGILDTNQPQNCDGLDCGDDCDGEGGENCCWGQWYSTIVAAKPTSQQWITRVRKVDFNDPELQQFTVTVESKYYLQIPIEDSDPIRILVDSGADTFAGSQGRGSKHTFTNEDFQAQIGEPVYGCLNIKKIERL